MSLQEFLTEPPTKIEEDKLIAWLNKLDYTMASRRHKPRMCIVGPPTACYFLASASPDMPAAELQTAGNSHQRRKVRRFFQRQRAELERVAAIPGDDGTRIMLHTSYPKPRK